ncbi:MAG: hypothetical protein R6V35_02130 [Candidatus Nanohaloarchaea archaeon]
MELLEQLLTFENVIDGSTAVVGAEAIYQAAVRSTFDYRDNARDLEISDLREEIDSMHVGHMIGEEGLHDEDAVVLDYFRPRRHQKKKHFAEVYNERISEESRDPPLDVEMYDDLLREEILMDM